MISSLKWVTDAEASREGNRFFQMVFCPCENENGELTGVDQGEVDPDFYVVLYLFHLLLSLIINCEDYRWELTKKAGSY